MVTSDLCPCSLQKELEDLVRKEHARIDSQSESMASPNPTSTASPKNSPPAAKDGEKPQ